MSTQIKDAYAVVQLDGRIVSYSDDCTAHKYHSPKPWYVEYHHTVPRAWQKHWKPKPTLPEIWDGRTVALCRTGHGNVHFLLVKLMVEYEKLYDNFLEVPNASRTTLAKEEIRKEIRSHPKELEIAALGMYRYLEWGGSLIELCRKKLYGYI